MNMSNELYTEEQALTSPVGSVFVKVLVKITEEEFALQQPVVVRQFGQPFRVMYAQLEGQS